MADDIKLVIKKSTLPQAGKGLFTQSFIPSGTRIIEYKGRVTTWNEVKEKEADNVYIMYVNRNHVINAQPYSKALARYANDAKGVGKIKGLRNNAVYATIKKRVYIKATRDIKAGEEILVDYGKSYWQTMRANRRIDEQKKREADPRKS
ncbi:SET domain-containing protein [Agriterribacter sp.]|uniref:SET domain-containing protein n=1 Tax=Agriterribacter sp. TaxID=2821509 RepID=UPI002D03F25D|nr:SET domain-containing protein [Agriterribacter sp.]HRO48131.1 SET domain-containing protein [Agriterribacter sp.]HRQ19132.1 SET domain-containing protein [Agriterribacter sp.]